MKLNDFDKTMMRLHWVGMRMQILHNEFYKIDTSTDLRYDWRLSPSNLRMTSAS